MLGIGAAGQQIDVVVGAARLARKDAMRGVAAGGVGLGRFAGLRVSDEHSAAIMHDRILHCRLEPAALPGLHPLKERADDAECEQHASASIAYRRSRLDWLFFL